MASGMEPVQLKYIFDMPTIAGTYYIDISQVASLCNRKGMRQGLNWVVSNIEYWTDGDSHMSISKLPDTWIMANSWVKAYHAWKTQQDSVLDDEPSIAGKYRDFKIFFDSQHETLGVGQNLLPYGFHTTSFGLDEMYDWDHTNIEIPTDGGALPPVRFNLHAIGNGTATSKSLVHGYSLSRARPNQEEPNMPLYGGWLQAISDVAEIDPYIRQDVQENQSPPYPVAAADGVNQAQEFYPGGAQQAETYQSYIQDILVTRASTALASDNSGSFLAPCGLLRLDIDHGIGGNDPTQIIIFLEVSPGPVKGFLAQPMQEMN